MCHDTVQILSVCVHIRIEILLKYNGKHTTTIFFSDAVENYFQRRAETIASEQPPLKVKHF